MSESNQEDENLEEQFPKWQTNVKKSPDRKILIEHKYSGHPKDDFPEHSAKDMEIERLRREKKELQDIVGIHAQKEFETEKAEVVSQYPTEKQEEIEQLIGEDTDVLEDIKLQLKINPQLKEESVFKRAPKGKSTIPSNEVPNESFNPQSNSYHDYVTNLYRRAKLSQNPIEKQDAENEIEALFNSYEKGMFEHKNVPFKTTSTMCLQCGSFLSGREAELYANRKAPCPVCGYTGGIVRNPKGAPY